MAPLFDHETLDVYKLALQFVGWTEQFVRGLPWSCRNARGQLIRSADSIPLNVAEGNAKKPGADRRHYLEIARASAAESAASLDVIVARGPRSPTDAEDGKILLHRIISILVKLSPPAP
jgi:four helix bundle protein